jgi:hypothetical protein
MAHLSSSVMCDQRRVRALTCFIYIRLQHVPATHIDSRGVLARRAMSAATEGSAFGPSGASLPSSWWTRPCNAGRRRGTQSSSREKTTKRTLLDQRAPCRSRPLIDGRFPTAAPGPRRITRHRQGALRARGIRPGAELERFPFDAAERLPNLDPRIVVLGYQIRKLPLTWSIPSM